MSAVPAPALRTLVIDDEPLARDGLRALLERMPDVEVVGEAGSGSDAIAAVRRLAPDLLLLDISMPEVDGFDVLEAIGAEGPPDTIFVTAHHDYAVRAFEVHAIDYLLKPVSPERLATALTRARDRLRRGEGGTRRLLDLSRSGALHKDALEGAPGAAPETARPEPRHLSRLAVRSVGRVRFVRVEKIDWIEAADYYANLHLKGHSFLIRQSMKSLEDGLDPRRFVRVHRSAIVNVESVREIQTRRHGGHTVILRDGTKVPLSRGRRRALEVLLP